MAKDRANFLYILDMPWPIAVLAALSACVFLGGAGLRVVYRPYYVPAGSMQPAIGVGDYVFVDKFAYAQRRSVARGDIVSFRPLEEGGAGPQYIKRVVGLPGDRVQIVDGVLWLNGRAVASTPLPAIEGDLLSAAGMESNESLSATREVLPDGPSYTAIDRYDGPGDHTEIYDVPEGMLFLLGDDRDNSRDSRAEMGGFLFVPIDQVEGKVVRTLDRSTPLATFLAFQRGYDPTEGQ